MDPSPVGLCEIGILRVAVVFYSIDFRPHGQCQHYLVPVLPLALHAEESAVVVAGNALAVDGHRHALAPFRDPEIQGKPLCPAGFQVDADLIPEGIGGVAFEFHVARVDAAGAVEGESVSASGRGHAHVLHVVGDDPVAAADAAEGLVAGGRVYYLPSGAGHRRCRREDLVDTVRALVVAHRLEIAADGHGAGVEEGAFDLVGPAGISRDAQ